jgi:hypothetical protein
MGSWRAVPGDVNTPLFRLSRGVSSWNKEERARGVRMMAGFVAGFNSASHSRVDRCTMQRMIHDFNQSS